AIQALGRLLSVVGVSQQRLDEAQALMEWGGLFVERTDDDLAWAAWAGGRADVLEEMGKHEEAKALQERVVTRREKVLGPDHPDVAAALNGLVATLTHMGRYDEARASQERALSINERTLGSDHPEVAGAAYNLAGVLMYMGRYEEAKALYDRAL